MLTATESNVRRSEEKGVKCDIKKDLPATKHFRSRMNPEQMKTCKLMTQDMNDLFYRSDSFN